MWKREGRNVWMGSTLYLEQEDTEAADIFYIQSENLTVKYKAPSCVYENVDVFTFQWKI